MLNHNTQGSILMLLSLLKLAIKAGSKQIVLSSSPKVGKLITSLSFNGAGRSKGECGRREGEEGRREGKEERREGGESGERML